MVGKIRVLVADDHSIVRQGLVALINRTRGMKVVAEASNGVEAVRKFQSHHPDISLIDLRMPELDGVEVIRTICEKHPGANIIVLTTFDDDEDIYNALRNGARAYLLKDITRNELVDSILAVHQGKNCIPPRVAEKLAAHIHISDLTSRQMQIVNLIASGKTNKEIAFSLGLTEGTVKIHVNHILHKLKASTRTEAASIALKRGLIRFQI